MIDLVYVFLIGGDDHEGGEDDYEERVSVPAVPREGETVLHMVKNYSPDIYDVESLSLEGIVHRVEYRSQTTYAGKNMNETSQTVVFIKDTKKTPWTAP